MAPPEGEPQRRDRHRLVPRIRRAFLAGGISLVAVGLTFAGLDAAHRSAWSWVLRSRNMSRIARDARALAVDRESAVRGFLLSGKEVSLEPDVIARPLLVEKVDSLLKMSSANASQNERARSIVRTLALWEAGYATPTIDRIRAGDSHLADDFAGKALFDNVRGAFDEFQTYEERSYQRLVAADAFIEKLSFGAVIIEILFLLMVLLRLRQRVLEQASELVEQQNQVEDQAAELEAQTVELEQQTEEKQETLALLELVLESAPIGFAFHDRDYRYTRINSALAAMGGRKAHEHVGHTPSEVYPDVGHQIEPILASVIATGKPVINVPLSRKIVNGSTAEHHYLLSFFPVMSPDGTTEGVGAVAIDTTERRHLEEQLQQAQKMEAVGRLAGGIAHDFNNILTAIKSYSELLIDDMNAGQARVADVHEIREASDRAANLTRQLLAFSRQQILRPRVLDLNSTVRDLNNMLERLIGDDIVLNTSLSSGLGMVTADPGQIEQILLNLIVNARDAMPDGGRIDIGTANVDLDEEYARTHGAAAKGPHVMLSVSDTGMGMSRETQKHLFEPFFTTKELGKGTGLGLSTVYGIVKQSGGWIWVYSELGHGTTFKIYLPRVEEKAEPVPFVPTGNGRDGAETILLVEDESTVREVASRILRRNGYTVVEAANGADALRQCEARVGSFDLIVTDIVMPEMGGLELAKRVRATQADAAILFTSGYTEEAVQRQKFLDAGAEFLEKPFTPAHLAQRARKLLDAKPRAGRVEHNDSQ